MAKWTEQDLKDLKSLLRTNNMTDTAKAMKRPYDSIRKKVKQLSIKSKITSDQIILKTKSEKNETNSKYKLLLKQNDKLKEENRAILDIRESPQELVIQPKKGKATEATAFMIASDWHIEERVRPGDVSDLNEFNLSIANKRINDFFTNGLRLVHIHKKESTIDHLVIGLLGDFISGSIHEELLENNQIPPIEAVRLAQDYIYSGLKYLLKNTDCKITVICKPGNHSRITKRIHHATEDGNSLESYMYYNLMNFAFKDEKRIEFIMSEGYHTYIDVYGYIIRMHHGHAIRYGGGVGGIYIPINKAIAQWNKGRKADLDVFAHFHQLIHGNNFVCNGSLIGYNAFALSIKADFERPQQAFFLVDKKMGKSVSAPIWIFN